MLSATSVGYNVSMIPSAILVVIIAAILGAIAWRRTRERRTAANLRRAAEEFVAEQPALEKSFLEAAAATGKPRGLIWKESTLNGNVVYARDKVTRENYALAGVTIRFEAVAGGAMEDVEAVGNLRAATAVFIWRNNTWTTDGRAVFNLEPREVVSHYGPSLEEVAI